MPSNQLPVPGTSTSVTLQSSNGRKRNRSNMSPRLPQKTIRIWCPNLRGRIKYYEQKSILMGTCAAIYTANICKIYTPLVARPNLTFSSTWNILDPDKVLQHSKCVCMGGGLLREVMSVSHLSKKWLTVPLYSLFSASFLPSSNSVLKRAFHIRTLIK